VAQTCKALGEIKKAEKSLEAGDHYRPAKTAVETKKKNRQRTPHKVGGTTRLLAAASRSACRCFDHK
jgi:hypothetical protein